MQSTDPRELRSTGRSIRRNAKLHTRRSRAPSTGVICKLEEFRTYIGLNLSYLIFGATEEVSLQLQSKKTKVDEAVQQVYEAKHIFCASAMKRQCCPGCEGSQYDLAIVQGVTQPVI